MAHNASEHSPILITGGAGFIGTHLARRLVAEGRRLRVLDCLSPQVHGAVPRDLDWLESPGVEFIRGTVTSRSDWVRSLQGVSTVVHLAAETGTGQSMYEVDRYYAANVQGTALLFDVLANTPTRTVRRVVLSSSRSVYGEGAFSCLSCGFRGTPPTRTAEHLRAGCWEPLCPRCSRELISAPTGETDAIIPASIYAATKYAQEDIVRIGCDALGLDRAILRFQNVYGEGQSLNNPYTGILSIFSTRIRRGLELPIFEDGKESRDFVHFSDVVEALVRCLLAPGEVKGVYNVGSGVGTSVLELAGSLSRAFGTEPKTRVTGQFRIGDIRHNVADLTTIPRDLGYHPRVSLDEGLRRFAKWVVSQPLPEDRLEQANRELIEKKLME